VVVLHRVALQELDLRQLKKLIGQLVIDVDPDSFQTPEEARAFLAANSLT